MYIFIIIVVFASESAATFAPWNQWSACSVTCGWGISSRERVAKFDKCYSEIAEKKQCNDVPCSTSYGNLTNLALNGSARGSSEFMEAFPASNIIDGNTNTDFYTGTCTQTNKDRQPWLTVELHATAMIAEVGIFNRGDCCSIRLNNMEVTVSEDPEGRNSTSTLCGSRRVMAGINMTRLKCPEAIVGRYVHVRIPGPQYLAICEIQVYGQENIAMGNVANQSSTYSYYNASYAVDGNLTTYSYADTYSPWWRVDLGKVAVIHKVRLYPYGSVFSYMRGTNVTVGHGTNGTEFTSCGTFNREDGKRDGVYYSYDMVCGKGIVGRYIQVQRSYFYSYRYLIIREFQAYGRYI